MASLFITVAEAFTPSLRRLVADALDETPDGVDRGLRCLTGGMVTGLIAAASTPSGASSVLRAVRGMDVGLLFDASPLLDTEWRDGAGPSLLGPRASALTEAAARDTAIRPQSARAMLELVEPLVLASIARSGVASDEAGLRSYLRSLEAEAMRIGPVLSGPSAVPDRGPTNVAEALAEVRGAPEQGSSPRSRRRGTPNAAVWLALLLLVALVLLFFAGGD